MSDNIFAAFASQRALKVGSGFPRQLSVPREGYITLSGGTPDFPTPPHIVKAGQDALAEGQTKYTPWRGIPPLLEALAHKLERDNRLTVNPETELLMTTGAEGAMMAVIFALVNPGDEVITPVPYYDEYQRDIQLAGGKLVPAYTRVEDDFEVKPEAIEAAITEKTKMLILVSPSNPTGGIIQGGTLEKIAKIAQKHNLVVISDELYERYIYGDNEHVSIASFPGMWERTIVINGFSKAYSMTGWRVGYIAAHEDFINTVIPINHGMTICAPAVSQWAALAALEGPHDWFEDVLVEYGKRRKIWMDALDEMKLPYGVPNGAYYVMFDNRSTGLSSQEFASAMKDEANVLLGGGGGAVDPLNEGFIRGSLAIPADKIEEGLERMAPVVAKYLDENGSK